MSMAACKACRSDTSNGFQPVQPCFSWLPCCTLPASDDMKKKASKTAKEFPARRKFNLRSDCSVGALLADYDW